MGRKPSVRAKPDKPPGKPDKPPPPGQTEEYYLRVTEAGDECAKYA